jgi:hypothetical protein
VSRSVLRAVLFAAGGVLVAGAGLLAAFGCAPGVSLRVGVPGLVLLLGLLVERWRYKPLTAGRPGPDWVPTRERFVDPESGKLVTVFYQPSTGERRYIAG